MLLESLVAISLIAVVMAAFTTFFVNAVASTSQQRATQVATQIANSAVDVIRGMPSSDPVNGRDATTVATQFDAASSTVSPWLSTMTRATDPRALSGVGTAAQVPTVGVLQTINNVSYTSNVYLGTCMIPTGVSGAACGVGTGTGTQYLRAVVAVTWAGPRCPPTRCTYLTSVLLSPVDDPLFNPNQTAPLAPTLSYAFMNQASNPGVLTVAVGDVVDLAATITGPPTTKVTITAGSLPAGLFLDTATGQITGKPSVVSGSTAVTLTITDGFGRAAALSFTSIVLAAVSVVSQTAQASLIGTAISAFTVSATGGTVPYTWSDPGSTLPPGLSLSTVNNKAVITGTPTTVGLPNSGVLPQTFVVLLTVKDSAGRTPTQPVSISWTINYPPFAAAVPGPQTSTVGTADTVALSVTGGSGSFSWSSTALPAGFTLTPAGVLSGTPTTVGVSSVVVMVTDTKSVKSTSPTVYASQNVTFQLTVYAKPTVSGPGNQSLTVGLVVPSTPLTTSCPNAPCTYVLDNGPGTFAINASGVLTGTVTSAPQTFSNVTVTVTDSAGATGTSAPFEVIVNAPPRVSNPGNQTAAAGIADSLDMAALTTGGTGPLTYSATNLPSWLSINPSTGLITGTAPATTTTTSGITVTVADYYGFSASSGTFSWAVTGSAPSAPRTVDAAEGDSAVTATWVAPATNNGSAVTGYTATLSPGGASCTTTNLTCTISGGLINGVVYSLTVTATNRFGTGPASTAVRAIPYPAGIMSAGNGMTLWLDGADPAVLLGSSSCTGAVTTTVIGCWLDKSGQSSANNFVQATTGNQPGVGTWNGLSAANFADPSDVMNSVRSTANYQTVFIAANVTNSAPYINLFGQAGADTNVRIGSSNLRSTPVGNDWSFSPNGPPQTLNFINGVRLANTNGPVKIITTDQSNAVKPIAASVSNTFSTRGVVGQIGDVITFDKPLTAPQRHAVEDYLAHKWFVPIKPSEPLTVAVVNASNAVTVSWTAPATGQVDSYTATASPGGASCTTTGLSCTIPGLAGGAYTVTVTATNDFGTGPPSAGVGALPFPSVMSAANGMSLWLDGSDPSVFFASSACTGAIATTNVGCWKDKSGAGINFTQSAGASQPAISTWNGRNAANFAAPAGRVLNSTSTGQYRTVFIAANTTGAAGTYNYLFGQAGADFSVRVGTTIPRSNPNGNDWSYNTGSPTRNWYNGEQATTKGQSGPMVTTDEAQSVQSFTASVGSTFNNAGVTRGVVGQIGDVITFSRVLSTAERKSVENYLGSKWNVVITP